MVTFAEKLLALRTERGLTLEALADRVGSTKQTLSRYENGLRVPKISMVEKLANALNVSINELSNKEDKENKPPDPPQSMSLRRWISLAPGYKEWPEDFQKSMETAVESIWKTYDDLSKIRKEDD